MDYERFKDSPSGQLVRVTGPEGEYYAFNPNPLPPKLPLDNAKLWLKLSEADRALGALSSPGPTVIGPVLQTLLLRREAVRSSRIEGTITTLSAMFAFEARQIPLFAEDNAALATSWATKEALNYVSSLEWGFKQLNNLPVSNRLIRYLHEILLTDVRGEEKTPGEFRRRQVAIGSPDHKLEEATFIPPPVPEMNKALGELEEYMNLSNDLPPLIRLALIHYQFEAIHPFLDGNGRIGRLMIPLLLHQWGLLPRPIFYLSVFFDRNRDAYYDHLLAISESGAWAEWIDFFLDGVIEQSQDVLVITDRLQTLRNSWHAKLDSPRTSANLVYLVDRLFLEPIISIPMVRKMLPVKSSAGARNLVMRLVDEGILAEFSKENQTHLYWSPEIINTIGEN